MRLGTDGIGVALEWLSKRDDIHACERRPRLTLTFVQTAQSKASLSAFTVGKYVSTSRLSPVLWQCVEVGNTSTEIRDPGKWETTRNEVT